MSEIRCRCAGCQGPPSCKCCDEPAFDLPVDLYGEGPPDLQPTIRRSTMSADPSPHPWTCRGCHTLLGMIEDGVLNPFVVPARIAPDGAARFLCVTCGREKVWFPAVASTARIRETSDHE